MLTVKVNQLCQCQPVNWLGKMIGGIVVPDIPVVGAGSGLADLQGKSARAWVFTASGDTAATLLALVQGIPQPSAVYTAAVMLAGKNLDGIRGMIHDVDPDTGA